MVRVVLQRRQGRIKIKQALTQGAIKENDATKLGLHFASIMNLFVEGRT